MCGRFARYVENQLLIEMLLTELPDLDIATFQDLGPAYNASPGQDLLAVGRSRPEHSHKFSMLRWGLIPSFARDLKGNHPINARAETIAQNGMFRRPFSRQRCLILASGFYEWRTDAPAPGVRGKPAKTPFFFTLRERPLMVLAGIYDVAKIGEQTHTTTCIVTNEANATVQPVHARMPVILAPGDFRRWCDPTIDGQGVADLLRPFPAEAMHLEPAQALLNRAPKLEDGSGRAAAD